jgi:hypothetical protein
VRLLGLVRNQLEVGYDFDLACNNDGLEWESFL